MNTTNNYTNKYWYKDGILKTEFYDNGLKGNITYITDYNKQIQYRINDKEKSMIIKKENQFNSFSSEDILNNIVGIYYSYGKGNWKEELKNAFDIYSNHVYQKKEIERNAQYYIIDYTKDTQIYDKNTKLIKYNIQYDKERVIVNKYQYQIDVVSDKDIEIPNLSNYQIIDQ